MVLEDGNKSGISANHSHRRASASSGSSHLAAIARAQHPQEPPYTAAVMNFANSIPSSRTASSEAQPPDNNEAQGSDNPFSLSARRLKMIVDQHSPGKHSHTAPVRHAARTRLANLTLPQGGGGISKHFYRGSPSMATGRPFGNPIPGARTAIQSPAPASDLNMQSQTPEEHVRETEEPQLGSQQPSPAPTDDQSVSGLKPAESILNPQFAQQKSQDHPVQGMTPSSSPPHIGIKQGQPPHQHQAQQLHRQPQHQQSQQASIPLMRKSLSSPGGPQPQQATNPSLHNENQPNVDQLIARMIAYTRTKESLKNTRDDPLHLPVSRQFPGLGSQHLQADLASADTLAPSPILSDMPTGAGVHSTRPVIRMHTDLNALRMNAGNRTGPIRKQPAWGFDPRPKSMTGPLMTHFQRPKTFSANPAASTDSLTVARDQRDQRDPRDQGRQVPQRSNSKSPVPSTPQPAPYSTPHERRSRSPFTSLPTETTLAPPNPAAVRSQSARHTQSQQGRGVDSHAEAARSELEKTKHSVSSRNEDTSGELQHQWTEHEWRQFSLAMRGSIASHGIKPELLISLFGDMRSRLPPEMKEISLGEVERRLTVWLNSTKKLREH